MAFCFTSKMIIAGVGGGSVLSLFKDLLCVSNNMKQAENIRVLSLGDCNIAGQ
jgi:ABC-type enterobactin transport system permease subunit